MARRLRVALELNLVSSAFVGCWLVGNPGLGIAAEQPRPRSNANVAAPAAAPGKTTPVAAEPGSTAAKSKTTPKLEITTVGAVDVPTPSTTKYQLTYKFKPGEVVRYEVVHEGEITIQFNEATQRDRNKSESRKNYRVISVDSNGSANLEMTMDWVHMTVKIGDRQPEVFKSDDPKFHPAKYSAILESVGKPQAVVTVSSTGKAIDIRPSPDAVANNPAKVSAPSADASPESYLCPLPDYPVQVGETWKERFELSAQAPDMLPFKVKMLREYRLINVEDARAHIDFKTSILTPVHDPSISAQLIQRETAGRIVFDLDRGVVVSRDVAVDRTVIGAFGPKSSMRAVSTYRERLQAAPAIARKP